MTDIRQTPEYAKYLKERGWIVETADSVNYFIRSIPIVGSIIKIQRPEKLSDKEIKVIKRLSKKYRAFQIIVEPKHDKDVQILTKNGFKQGRSPFLPSKTLILDLTKSENQLRTGLKKDCRYALRRTKNMPLKVVKVGKFRKAWKGAVGLRKHVPSPASLSALSQSFSTPSPLLLTSHNGNAGAIFIIANKSAYYWQAFTSRKGRASLAQYAVVWAGIRWAKKHGAKTFDFEGIYDSRFPNKSWLGFTHFKKAFGGKEKEYPGVFIKNRLPL